MSLSGQSLTPSWPSLYSPGLEILHIEHRGSTQPGGAYLYHAHDIFRFTLYWTLIFYTPIFLLCGTYAFWNLTFPPFPRSYAHPHLRDTSYDEPSSSYQLFPHTSSPSPPQTTMLKHTAFRSPRKLPKPKERRSRVAFSVIVLFTFLLLSVAGAVLGSAVLGFALTGLYRAANYHMSTWIPFLLAVIQVLVGLLSIWPSVIDII